MSDEKYASKPLPEMVEKPCEVCGRPTVVAKDYTGTVRCIEHDERLTEEMMSDGI